MKINKFKPPEPTASGRDAEHDPAQDCEDSVQDPVQKPPLDEQHDHSPHSDGKDSYVEDEEETCKEVIFNLILSFPFDLINFINCFSPLVFEKIPEEPELDGDLPSCLLVSEDSADDDDVGKKQHDVSHDGLPESQDDPLLIRRNEDHGVSDDDDEDDEDGNGVI